MSLGRYSIIILQRNFLDKSQEFVKWSAMELYIRVGLPVLHNLYWYQSTEYVSILRYDPLECMRCLKCLSYLNKCNKEDNVFTAERDLKGLRAKV